MTRTPVRHRPLAILLLYALYALDVTGYCINFVIFAPMVLDPAATIVAASTSVATRNLLYGLLIAAYPATQFFGAPILGELSDRFGRRIIILVAAFGTGIAFFGTAFAIDLNILWLVFLSRLIGGFLAGSMTVAQATIADFTTREQRGRYMAAFTMLAGLSWTIGPYLGAILSNPAILPFFSYATPFWLFGLLFIICGVVGLLCFHKVVRAVRQPLHIGHAFRNLAAVFRMTHVAIPLFIAAMTLFGWLIYQSFLAPYLIQWYQFTEMREGFAYGFSSFFWFAGGLLGNLWLLKKFSARRVIVIPIIAASLAVLSFLFFHDTHGIWPAMAVGNFSQAIVQAGFFTLFSLLVSSEMQGRVFGAYNAALAGGAALSPLLAGWLARYWINLPYLISTVILLFFAGAYLLWARRHPEVDTHQAD